jgi:KaiC/GvpD/RAD55 family RecA-like ATPase
MLLVEFDPESQWFPLATTLAGLFHRMNHYVCYLAMARLPSDVKQALTALTIDVNAAVKSGRLVVEDWYSASLSGGRLETADGRAGAFEFVDGELRANTLKVADLSVEWLKTSKTGPKPYDIVDHWPPGSLVIVESFSTILRFNEEKPFVEWMESRVNPEERKRKGITLQGFVRGIHSEWLYKRMENACDGVIDIRVMERGDEAKNLFRIRSLKGQPHDSRWHEIEIKPSGEVRLAP